MRNYSNKGEKNTKLILVYMQYPAWRALSPKVQALHSWLKMEWKGHKANNNGKISLSVRQAAKWMGVSNDTAVEAFHELQVKGLIVITEPASLGVKGQGKCPKYEINELDLPGEPRGRCLFSKWKKGPDLPVIKTNISNVIRKTKPRPNNSDPTVLASRPK